MFLVLELLFILVLSMVLYMLYRNDRALAKNGLRRAMMEECWEGKERRAHVRFKKCLEVSYAHRKRPQASASNGKTVDISLGGAKLLLEEKLAKGAILFLKLVLPETGHAVEAEGEIVWSEEQGGKDPDGRRMFHAGVKFLTVKSPTETPLFDYIRKLPDTVEA